MRRLVIGLLLGAAMVGAPAAAQRWQDRTPDGGDQAQTRDDRQEARENRENNRDGQRPQQAERPQPQRQEQARGEGRNDAAAPAAQDRDGFRRDQNTRRGQVAAGTPQQRDGRPGRGDGYGGRGWQDNRNDPRMVGRDGRLAAPERDWRNERNGQAARQDWRDDSGPGDRRGDAGRFDRNDAGRGSYGSGYAGRSENRSRWNQNWRQDRRYDWQRYRQGNRNLFRAPRYYAPRGYTGNYRRWSAGFRLQPYFYAQSYWISDPYYYRLPPADGPFRWVRYYDDVLLVDLRSGEVVDAIYDFFW